MIARTDLPNILETKTKGEISSLESHSIYKAGNTIQKKLHSAVTK